MCNIYEVHFKLYFMVEANNMNPDQTAPLSTGTGTHGL